MAEPLTLDQLEKLLEEMEPAAIRAQFGEALKAQPQCLAMLSHFESMDEDLESLKASTPPAPQRAPTQHIATVAPMRPVQAARPHPLWRLTRLALPLAAAIVVALLLFTRSPQIMQAERNVPLELPEERSVALELPEALPSSPDAAPERSASAEAYDTRQGKHYGVVQEDKASLKDADAGNEAAAPQLPAGRRNSQIPAPRLSAPERKQEQAKDNHIVEKSDMAQAALQKEAVADQEAGGPAPVLMDKLSEQSEALAPAPLESGSAAAIPQASGYRDEAKKRASEPADDLSPGSAKFKARQASKESLVSVDRSSIVRWLQAYEKRLGDLSLNDGTLFSKDADIRRPAAASGWPQLMLESVESANSAWLMALDASGNALGRVHLVLNGEGLCIALIAE